MPFVKYLDLSDEIADTCSTWQSFMVLVEKLDLQISRFISERLGELDLSLTRVFFGAGGHGRYLLKACRALNIPVDYFSDNDLDNNQCPWLTSNPKKQHTYVDGLYVLEPSELARLDNHSIVIATNIPRFRREIRLQLEEFGLSIMAEPECYLYEALIIRSFLNFYLAHMGQLREVFYNLADDRSHQVYLAILKARIMPYELAGTFYAEVMEGDQYWALPQFRNIKDAVFIDAGAAAGDTVRKFLANNSQNWSKIYAFEPDTSLFESLRNLQDMKSCSPGLFQCVLSGLGSFKLHRPSRLVMQRKIRAPLSMPQTMELPEPERLTTVDTILAGRRASFIKADIEGFEQDMLQGAAETIKRWKPHLAICMYHLPGDLFEIPLYIKKLVPEYKMAVRHHSSDLPETVLYCWV